MYHGGMRARACIREGALGIAVGWSAACTKPLPTDGSTPARVASVPAAAAAESSGGATPVVEPIEPEPIEPELPESAGVEWEESPLSVDLDGDGREESISWTCGGTLVLAVGRARSREAYQVSEEIGCSAAVVRLRPGEATRQLVLTIDEHEEVGPDLHFLYAYREGKLESLWSATAGVDFLMDGSWVTQTSRCDEARGYIATRIGRHRWDGEEVTSEESEERTPIEPGDCAEP